MDLPPSSRMHTSSYVPVPLSEKEKRGSRKTSRPSTPPPVPPAWMKVATGDEDLTATRGGTAKTVTRLDGERDKDLSRKLFPPIKEKE